MDLESAAECEVAVHDYACCIAGPKLGRAGAAKVGLERDVVNEVSRELETVAKNLHTTTQNAQLYDFIVEAVSRSDAKFSEVSLGDFHLRGEAIVRGTGFIVQTRLPARVHSDHRLEACFESDA
jgi:hypothetical protein